VPTHRPKKFVGCRKVGFVMSLHKKTVAAEGNWLNQYAKLHGVQTRFSLLMWFWHAVVVIPDSYDECDLVSASYPEFSNRRQSPCMVRFLGNE
jgi:hypothetical protein